MSDLEQAATETPAATFEEVAASIFGAEASEAPGTSADAVEAKEAPPAPEPAKDPVAERVAARIEVAKRVELRAAAAREEARTARAELDARRAELEEMAQAVEAFKGAKLSPSKALELLGMTPKEFLETLATEHEPAAVAARAVQGTQSEVAKLQAKIDAMEKAAAQREHQARAEVGESNYNAATVQFLGHVDAAPEKYPHLIAEYTPSELASAARAAAERHAQPYFDKFGEFPDDDVIADYLEEQARTRAEALAERRARVGKPAPVPSKGVSSGVQQVAQPDSGPSPRTLTSRAASEKATAPPKWSQEQADEESLRILSAALRAG